VNLTAAAIANNRVTAVALLLIALFGYQSYLTLPRSEDPGFIVRTAVVTSFYPGASPERIEQLVTDKIEARIQEIPELDKVRSLSKTGVSIIWVDIQSRYTDLRPIWDKLRRKVESARSSLPGGVRGPFVNDEFGDVFGIVVSLVGDGFSYRELEQVADEVRSDLLRIGEVAKVDIYGAQDERIFIEYDNARLAELGLSPVQLRGILEGQNIILGGGQVRTALEAIVIEPSGSFESVEDLARTLVEIPGSRDVLPLQDIARVSRGYIDPPRSRMRTGGEPSLGLAIAMREGGNILELGDRARDVIRAAEARYPIGIEFEVLQFQPDAVGQKIDDFVGNLLQAIVIVVVVMLLFLGARAGMVVGSLIPMTMLLAMCVMGVMGIGLDQISLAALIIALGMMVDNGIVMSESILVQMQRGRPAVDAAIDAANELRVPLLTSSLTTAAAFLPIYLAESSAGEYTAPLFLVVTITLLSSWILSLTMIPLLAVHSLRTSGGDGESAEPSEPAWQASYRRTLFALLRRPIASLAATAALFALSLVGFGQVPNIFFPPNDRPTFTADLSLPVGTPIERTEEVVVAFDQFIRENLTASEADSREGITSWATFIGQGGPRFILTYSPELSAPEYAFLLMNASSRDSVDSMIPALESFGREHFPELETTVRPLELGPPAWPPVAVRVSGPDTAQVFGVADAVKAKIRSLPGSRLVSDDWGPRAKKLRVEIDPARAARAGVTNQDIAVSLQTFFSGFDTTEFREGDKVIPVTLRSVAELRLDVGSVDSINVYSQVTGRSVPLKQVADTRVVWEPAKIHRSRRMRTVTIEAGLAPGLTAAQFNAQLVPWLNSQSASWPDSVSWELGGEVETSGKSQASIAEKLPLAFLVILLLLVGQFNSIRRPLIILITIPLGLIGVVIGLLALRSYFGFMTLLGVVSLAGIVINNAIVLLDRIRIEIDEVGRSPQEAVVEAAQQRLRPILLTTATTIAGLIPLYLGGGPMFEPMAVAIMFGLVFATVLTLGVVPVLYAVFFRISFVGAPHSDGPEA